MVTDIEEMQKTFNRAKGMKCPVFIHVLTQKGHGYKPAEENPDKFHGIGPFNLEDGSPLSNGNSSSYTEVFSDALLNLGRKDPKIVSITAAMQQGTGVDKFFTEFPERSFDVGIAEQYAVTFAAALAKAGFKPVVSIYSTFLQRAYDQILHDVCLSKLPVTFVIDRAGIVGEDGSTHQGIYDISYLRTIPELLMMAPKDENELAKMLKTALEYQGPAVIRYPRGAGPGAVVAQEIETIPVVKAEILCEGSDAAIFAIGSMVYPALKAADILAEKGISVTVVNARFIKPLDQQTLLTIARKIGRVMTVEENSITGGFGSACLELLKNKHISIEIAALPDQFITHGKSGQLLELYGLTGEKISERIYNTWFKDRG